MLIRCECGWEKNVKDELAGRKAQCPQCSQKFVVQAAEPLVQSVPLTFENELARTSPDRTLQRRNETAVRMTEQEFKTPTTHVTVERVRPQSNSCGVGSVILGILGLFVCWIPLLGLAGGAFAALGLLLGMIGCLVAFGRSGGGLGYSIAGSAICSMALLICFVVNSLFIAPVAIPAAIQAQAAMDRTKKRREAEEKNPGAVFPKFPEFPEPNFGPDAVAKASPKNTTRPEPVVATATTTPPTETVPPLATFQTPEPMPKVIAGSVAAPEKPVVLPDLPKPVEKSEDELAASDLKLAQSLISKNPDAAETRLRKLIEKYPETESAEKAQKLLNKLAGE